MVTDSSDIEILRSFHSVDRELYSRLVIDMGRDRRQCMHMIAFWLWLDEIGYPSIVPKMLTLPDWVVNVLADEAVRCLDCIHSETPPPFLPSTVTAEIPVTQALMEDKQITLSTFIYPNRQSALRRTTKTVNNLCFRASFEDIKITQAAAALANDNHTHDHHQQDKQEKEVGDQLINPAVQGIADQPMTSSSTYCSVLQKVLVRPSVEPHAAAGSSSSSSSSSSSLKRGKSSLASVLNRNDNTNVPRSKRILFITFSRGFPIKENELREFLVGSYGSDCVEELYMGKVDPECRQSLYALLVVRSATVVTAILNGKERAKLVINGNRARARLYV